MDELVKKKIEDMMIKNYPKPIEVINTYNCKYILVQENGNRVLLECRTNIMPHKDFVYIFEFGENEIITTVVEKIAVSYLNGKENILVYLKI